MVRVVSMEFIDIETEVFDIEVDIDNSFVVGGVVVHNSDVCKHRDGLRWTIDNEPIGHDVIFIEPPLHYNCRSIIIILIDKNHPKTRASEFGEVDGSINYEKWLKSQSDSYQDKVLGKTRARWFREGKLDLRKMLNQEDRPLTIEQLRNKYNL